MRGAYCYLPILPARRGAFLAAQWLSPLAESRLIPLFDIPDPVVRNGETLEKHFAKRAKGIGEAWPRSRSVYVDMHNLPSEVHMASGEHPLTFVFDLLRMQGARAIPVTGTTADRHPAYTIAVRAITRRDRRGLCLRLAREDFENRSTLADSISEVLDFQGLSPAECDLILDFRYLVAGEAGTLRGLSLEALDISRQLGRFRNVILAGGSVPEQLGKQDQGQLRSESRVEFSLWAELIKTIPLVYADYGVVSPTYVPPKRAVNVPARIRYTTHAEHVFRRGRRADYVTLCNELIASPEFSGQDFSLGDLRIHQCAKGIVKPGNPTLWVGSDLNHHFEMVSQQIWQAISASGNAGHFSLPEPEHRPYLQPDLIAE